MKLPTKKPRGQANGVTEEMHKLALWIPANDVQELKLVALEKGTTMSIILRKLIKDYLK